MRVDVCVCLCMYICVIPARPAPLGRWLMCIPNVCVCVRVYTYIRMGGWVGVCGCV